MDSSLRFKLEIEQRPSLEELKAMIEEFEVDDGWSDLGFAMSDTDQYIRWLSGSYSKEEISIAIVRKDDGMVSLPHLMTSLQERRTDLLGSLNRRTRTADEGPAEDESIERVNVVEDAVVLVTNDGWIKRLRPNELGSTSMREGDGALALVGGSTKENVILFTNKGTAYNLRIDEVPQSAGHGTLAHQLVKFKDGERVIAALGTDPRVMTEFGFSKPDLGPEYEEPYPHMIAVTKRGMALRFTLWPHKDPSTVRGRMFGRTRDGDEFITVFKVYAEDDVAALSRQGKLLVASTQEVSLLGGPGLGVVLIKLDDGDELVAATQSKLLIQVERLSGGPQNVSGSEFKAVARGGKGTALWKRGTVKRVVLPVPTEPNLGAKEDKAPSASGKA